MYIYACFFTLSEIQNEDFGYGKNKCLLKP